MVDLYRREAKIESTKRRFKPVCPHCFDILESFERQLKLNNYSIGRIEKYWSFLKAVHENAEVCFDKAKRKHLENLIIKITDSERWSEYTKHDFKTIIKFFYRWISSGNLEGDYPDSVKWIKTKIKKIDRKTPDQILTKLEIELLAQQTTTTPRDRALVLTLYESGCRISELLNIKIKDIQFDQYGCYILVSGKTGWRRVRIIEYSKDLLKWLDSHPFKDNTESFVWISIENPSPEVSVNPATVNNLLRTLAKKCNITKPIHPHAFRHARATHLAKHLPEAVMKQMFGWTNDSDMASVYVHLDGKAVDECLLKLHGIKSDEMKEVKSGNKVCQNCGENNSLLTHFCKKCNTPLDLKMVVELDNKRIKLEELLRDFLIYYSEKNKEFKKIFVEFVKKRKAEEVFV